MPTRHAPALTQIVYFILKNFILQIKTKSQNGSPENGMKTFKAMNPEDDEVRI